MRYLKHPPVLAIVRFIGIMLLLSGCQASSESPETNLKSILASETRCTTPCWRSLQPGLSTEKDFLNLVDTSNSDLFNDMKHTELNPEGVEYGWEDKKYDIFARVRIHEDRVKLFGFQQVQNKITLSNIIELLGQPSMYGASVLGSHNYYVKFSLIYEKDGTIIEANFPIDLEQKQIVTATCEFKIEWDTIPDRLYIYLVESGTAEEMVQNDPVGGFNNPTHKPQLWENESPINLTLCP